MVSSERCEIEGVILGMETVIQYINNNHTQGYRGNIYLFSDCQNAIDNITKRTHYNSHPAIRDRLQNISRNLNDLACTVKLIKIPAHVGIYGNDLADQKAKDIACYIASGKSSASKVISVTDAQKISKEIATNSWQRKWNEDSKGRYTYDLIPSVNTRILWPKTRGIGISYCRILLNDTMLNDDSHRTGTSDTPLCPCGEDKETVTHVLFCCSNHSKTRYHLSDIIEDSSIFPRNQYSVSEKVKMIVAPPCDDSISKCDNRRLKEALFQFIDGIDRNP